MTSRFLEQRAAVQAAAEDPEVVRLNPELRHELPESRERAKLEILEEVLEPFKSATLTLSSDREVTSSLAIPTAQIMDSVATVSADDPGWLADVKDRMKTNLDKWNTKDNNSLKIASILDPNTRNFIVGNKRQLLTPLVIEVIESTSPVSLLPDCPPSLTQPDIEPPKKKPKLTTSYDWLRSFHPMNRDEEEAPLQSLVPVTAANTARKEIDRFLAMPDSNLPPLDWWRIHEPEFPNIAEVARTYLAIQATGVPSERLWSVSGNVLTKKTARLTNENFEAQVLLHINRTKAMKLQSSRKRKAPDS